MKLEFAHLDQPWFLINYKPRKTSKNSYFFALTNIGIMFPSIWNKILSNKNSRKGIIGKYLFDYIEGSPVDVLFERQVHQTGSNRSGTLRDGCKSVFYEFYTNENLIFLKNGLLSNIEPSKIYYSDSDLYHLGEQIFLDALKIHPMFAASLSQIREVKYAVFCNKRSQCRDRFSKKNLQKLILGDIKLQMPDNYRFSIIPEYQIYLENKNNNVDECNMISYNLNTLNTKEKKMAFSKNNKIRSNGRQKNIITLLGKYDMEGIQIAYELRDNYEPNLDPKNPKHMKNVRRSLRQLFNARLIKFSKKTGKYSLNLLPKVKKVKNEKLEAAAASCGPDVASDITSGIMLNIEDMVTQAVAKKMKELKLK
jgi:hypothetical protein